MKINKIVLEGIDKTGKDLLINYINELTNYKYVVSSRGIVSVMSYNDIYNRDYIEYDLENEKNILNVLLTVDKIDWEIRCKLSNEPKINYELNDTIFKKNFDKLTTEKLIYNTSEYTPYQIAKYIKQKMEELNNEN